MSTEMSESETNISHMPTTHSQQICIVPVCRNDTCPTWDKSVHSSNHHPKDKFPLNQEQHKIAKLLTDVEDTFVDGRARGPLCIGLQFTQLVAG